MSEHSPSHPVRVSAALTLALLAPALGGGTSPFATAVLMAGAGLIAVALPARWACNAWFLAAGVLLLVALDWALPAAPMPWRARLVEQGLPAGPVNSPQPWLSLRAWLLLAGGLLWLGWCAGQAWSERDRRTICEGLSAGIGLIALVALARIPVPGWPQGTGLGPFANRNQTAVLFAMGAFLTLACGAERLRRLQRRHHSAMFFGLGFAWLCMLAVDIAALGANKSRSGPLLFVAMSVAWALAVVPWRKRKAETLAIFAAVALLLGTLFLLTGHSVLERIAGSRLADFRLKIFSDAIHMIRDSLWTGAGLGNFSAIFPLYRRASILQQRVLHPESDWLWLTAETGLPGLLAAAALLAWMGARAWRGLARAVTREDRALRLAVFIACAGVLAHSFQDVPGHRLGSIMPALLLLGIAAEPSGARRSGWPLRAWGCAILALGSAGMFMLAAHIATPLSSDLDLLGNDAPDAAAVSKLLAWAPLDWTLYTDRARREGLHGKILEALSDFRRANFLEPDYAWLPFDEGCYWMKIAPRLAIGPWREALRRCPPERRGEMYAQMNGVASGASPELRADLAKLGEGDPVLSLITLRGATQAEFPGCLAGILARDPALSRFTVAQRALIFELWFENGQPARMAALLLQNPGLLESGYRSLAEYKASQGDFAGAVALMQRFYPPPLLPRVFGISHPEAAQRFADNPGDIAAGMSLLHDAEEAGQTAEAIRILGLLAKNPNCPAYVQWLAGGLLAKQNRLDAAWRAFDQLPR
ncbi:MAG TPA: O-antigen ligase family protein [Chthoniobacteraceae bacterium]|nr:O-antigen ligase family protein [Chthoniobacteraceae bacterium]